MLCLTLIPGPRNPKQLLLINSKIKLSARSTACHKSGSETGVPLDAVWLGKTLQQHIGLSSPMCPECLGTSEPLQSPLESIQGSDRCFFKKEGKKKNCSDISRERTSHVKHVKQTAEFHQYSWKRSTVGGWRHRGICQSFLLVSECV